MTEFIPYEVSARARSRGRHCAVDARRGVVGEEFGRARRVSTEASRLARGFRAASREDASTKFLSPGVPSKTRSPPLAGGPSASVRSGARARARATISFMAARRAELVFFSQTFVGFGFGHGRLSLSDSLWQQI